MTGFTHIGHDRLRDASRRPVRLLPIRARRLQFFPQGLRVRGGAALILPVAAGTSAPGGCVMSYWRSRNT